MEEKFRRPRPRVPDPPPESEEVVDQEAQDRLRQEREGGKPPEADAVGESSVEELVQDMEDQVIREQEAHTQRDNIRARPRRR